MRINDISDEDISVIVQGKIINSNSSTKKVCESVRKMLPNAELIVSTWEGECSDGLEYDDIIFNKNISSLKIIRQGETDPVLHSVNHQIITTLSGLKRASRKYALKLRSDLCLVNANFLNYFDVYNDFPSDAELTVWRMFNSRILTLPTHNVRGNLCFPFNISDWMYFGLRNDLLYLFDIPLLDMESLNIRAGEKYPHVEDNLGAEQYIWLACLNKKMNVSINGAMDISETAKMKSEIAIANNFVPISAKKLGVYSLKFGLGGYATDPKYSRTLYSLRDWEKLYNRYGGGHVRIKILSGEMLITWVYRLLWNLLDRFTFLKKLYKKIVKYLHLFQERKERNAVK